MAPAKRETGASMEYGDFILIKDSGPGNLRIPFIIESRGKKENDTLQQ